MATKISTEDLRALVDKKAISGVVLIRNYSTQLTKGNKEYITGELVSGDMMSFKAWNSSPAFITLKTEDLTNKTALISGIFDNYNGVWSIILESIQVNNEFDVSDFLTVKYDADAYAKQLETVSKQYVSDYMKSFMDKVLFKNDAVMEKFKIEFAASSHHDNCKSGLLAHTYKVVANLSNILVMYPNLYKCINKSDSQQILDMLYAGALLHDIGKIDEMHLGVYQPCSVVTHRILGIEYIYGYKDELIKQYSEDWFYNFVSIFVQHHGAYDDKCRSLYAYIVHQADLLDSRMSLISQMKESLPDKIKVDDMILSYFK